MDGEAQAASSEQRPGRPQRTTGDGAWAAPTDAHSKRSCRAVGPAARRRCVEHRLPRAIVLAAALLPLGCGSADRGGRGRTAGPPSARESFSEQLAAVRAGHGDRIDATDAPDADDWRALRGLAGLRVLVLRRGIATDAEAEILASLPDIERLVLRESPLTDRGFRSLARCRQLHDLNVPQAACTAAGIESLASLPKLRGLRLGGPNLGDPNLGDPNLGGPAAARAVATLAGLRSLHLIDVPIGDEGLAALGELAALESLYLDGAGVSEEAWAGYFRTHPHVHVHVDQAHHDRDPRRGHDASDHSREGR